MKRFIFKVILFLLLGAIINVAVAWGVVWLGVEHQLDAAGDAGAPLEFDDQGFVTESWWVERFDGFASTILNSNRIRYSHSEVWIYDPLKHPLDVLPRWKIFDPSPEYVSRQTEGDHHIVNLRGWPMRALGCVTQIDYWTGQRQHRMGIETLVRHDSLIDMPVLPLRPLWPGFAINTIFYTLILWLLFAAPFTVRRWRRARKGLCPKCAYPIGTSDICTECGKPVRRKAAPQQTETA